MKIQNGNKTDLLDRLVKTAQVKPQKDTSVDQRKGDEIGYGDKVEISSRKQEIENLAAQGEGSARRPGRKSRGSQTGY